MVAKRGEPLDLADYGRAIVRGWQMVIACVLAGLGAAALITASSTPVYQSRVDFFVVSPTTASQSALQARELSKGRILAYASLVKSDKFVEELLRNSGTGLPADVISESISASADRETLILSVVVSMPDQVMAVETAKTIAASLSYWVGGLESGRTRLSVVAGPTEDTVPVSPREALNLAVGGVLGLGTGITLAVTRRLRGKALWRAEEIESAAGLPLLAVAAVGTGTIRTLAAAPAPSGPGTGAGPVAPAPGPGTGAKPGAPAAGKARAAGKGVTARRKREVFLLEEAGRRLRTNIDHFRAMPASGIVVVTSATAEEGRSSAAFLLARSWAEAGVSVLLVEGDLRRPSLAADLELDGRFGLTDVLAGRVALAEAIQHPEGNGPHILAAGQVPAKPTEILAGPAATAVLGQLRDRYSRVVIDAPAMQPFSDAALLAANADCTVLVLSPGHVTSELLKSSLRDLELVGAVLAGFVFTGLRRRARVASRPRGGKASPQTAAAPADVPAGVPAVAPAQVPAAAAATAPAGVHADTPPDKRAVTRR